MQQLLPEKQAMHSSHRHFFLFSLTLTLTLCLGGLTGCAPKRISGLPMGQATANTSLVGAKVVRTATTQLGKPYRSGGETPQKGFDCSGLIYWSYRQHGIQVPRVTTAQAAAGQAVSRSKLLPGDIVVFRASSGPNGLHTGIYAGQGRFIHSPNRKSRVRVDSLSTPYWSKTYLTGRRIVSPIADR